MSDSLIEKLKDCTQVLPGFNDEMVRLNDVIAIVRQHQVDQPMQDDGYEIAKSRRHEKGGVDIDDLLPDEPSEMRLLSPDMPAQELRLHMGELTAQEERTARAAIRWANSVRSPEPVSRQVENHIYDKINDMMNELGEDLKQCLSIIGEYISSVRHHQLHPVRGDYAE